MDPTEELVRLTKSGLVIPQRMNDEPTHRCNVPGCDQLFYAGEERARVTHALTHAGDEDEIHELTRSRNDEILGEGDPEYQSYLENRYRNLKGQVPDPLDPKRY